MNPVFVKVLMSIVSCIASIYLQYQLTQGCPIFFLAADLIGLTFHQYFTERRIQMKSSCGYDFSINLAFAFLIMFTATMFDLIISSRIITFFLSVMYLRMCASYLYIH